MTHPQLPLTAVPGDLLLLVYFEKGFRLCFFVGVCSRVRPGPAGPQIFLFRRRDRSVLRFPLASPTLVALRLLRQSSPQKSRAFAHLGGGRAV